MQSVEVEKTVGKDIQKLYEAHKKNAFENIKSTNYQTRKTKLQKLQNYITDNSNLIQEAIYKDFKKPAAEVDLTEVYSVIANIKHAIQNLRSWMRPKFVSTPLSLFGSTSHIQYEAKGATLIISPWNYPFYLAVSPLIYAIAAGNCAIIKPSEMTPHTSQVIEDMMEALFDQNEVTVIQGGVDVSTELLKLKFDHIFFTGSPAVGKIIMKAAAQHLTSVTLELGGKSPVIVDKSADLKDASEKITWGKFLNNGQTCIAPDYLLVHESQKDALIDLFKEDIQKKYKSEGNQSIEESNSYARIINEKHHQRLSNLISDAVEKGAKVEFGGTLNPKDCYIEPTVISNVNDSMDILQEEIFGPLLPVVTYKSLDEALKYVNEKEKPLALYIFSKSQKQAKSILNKTTAGGTCINDCIIHIGHPDLPFGGVNNSGIGKSHGFYGFTAFSNERSVLKQRVGFTGIKMFYPPYTPKVHSLVKLLIKYL